MLKINGTVERITYYNKENGYTVLRLRPKFEGKERMPGLSLEGLLTVIGNLPQLSPGESIQLEGDFTTHPKHGIQFKVYQCEKIEPATASAIEKYLGSGLIKGIGPKLAKRIVDVYKERTLDIIEKEPDKLGEVPGIGTDRKNKVIEAWEEQKNIKEIMLFLHGHDISTNLAIKIFKTYGENSLNVLKENPYQLEEDIYGVGFKTADRLARALGLPEEHPSRIEAGIIYAINESLNEGHVFSNVDALTQSTAELLNLETGLITDGFDRLSERGRIEIESDTTNSHPQDQNNLEIAESQSNYGNPIVYLTPFYFSEKGVAEKIRSLLSYNAPPKQTRLLLASDKLSPEQEEALKQVIINNVSVLTGGPGTGKTTCLKALINYLESQNIKYALVSPTGRAAKRLSEATSRPASTIHRMLAYSPGSGYKYNKDYPLNIQFLIIDEGSMLDLLLAHHLLQALRPGTQVLFVGDVDQLPPVGAGNVLRDIIKSKKVPVLKLNKIYRQAENSEIISNAHRINQGKFPVFSKTSEGDFFLFPAENDQKASDWIIDLVSTRIPNQFNMDPIDDIQVLSPMYRGFAGVDHLNEKLQDHLNPESHPKNEAALFGRVYRVGDKVMQIRNNYDKDVFNGDIGKIKNIDVIDQIITVEFDQVSKTYDYTEIDELVLAYAISVHKSQGSEFPAVVIPAITQHYVMLQRNLIYTAVTRAEKLCVIVGNQKAIHIALKNQKIHLRNSRLAQRIGISSFQ